MAKERPSLVGFLDKKAEQDKEDKQDTQDIKDKQEEQDMKDKQAEQEEQDMKDKQAEQDKKAEQAEKKKKKKKKKKKNEPEKKTASFRIEAALLDRLREARWTLRRSQADIIEAALKEYLSRFPGV